MIEGNLIHSNQINKLFLNLSHRFRIEKIIETKKLKHPILIRDRITHCLKGISSTKYFDNQYVGLKGKLEFFIGYGNGKFSSSTFHMISTPITSIYKEFQRIFKIFNLLMSIIQVNIVLIVRK